MVNPDFWRGRRVWLTGHTGFKGSWLALWLRRMGAEVSGLALPPEGETNLFDSLNLADELSHRIGDIRDPQVVLDAVRAAEPEIVFHLAAQPLVRLSYEQPLETYATNVMGTAHVLDAIRHVAGIRAVVVVTSDKCYADQGIARGYREDDPMGGSDPYSGSKGATELVTASYRHSFFHPDRHAEHGVAIASARAGNVIGGGDWARDRLIPDFFRAAEAGKNMVLRYPNAVRPWQHVLEPLAGYLRLAEKLHANGPQHSEGWNFGPAIEDCVTVQTVVKRLCELWGDDASWQIDPTAQPHESHLLMLDHSKSEARLGWSPRWRLNDALRATVAWQRAFLDEADLHDFSVSQIDTFSNPTT